MKHLRVVLVGLINAPAPRDPAGFKRLNSSQCLAHRKAVFLALNRQALQIGWHNPDNDGPEAL